MKTSKAVAWLAFVVAALCVPPREAKSITIQSATPVVGQTTGENLDPTEAFGYVFTLSQPFAVDGPDTVAGAIASGGNFDFFLFGPFTGAPTTDPFFGAGVVGLPQSVPGGATTYLAPSPGGIILAPGTYMIGVRFAAAGVFLGTANTSVDSPNLYSWGGTSWTNTALELDISIHGNPVAPVPEPGTAALAALGVAAFGAAARRRRA